jgi:manganese/zinc/iron transport system substrate-binding protein
MTSFPFLDHVRWGGLRLQRVFWRVLLAMLLSAPLGLSAKHWVATTTMAGDLVRQLAAADDRVTTLMAPGVDPHQYRATRRDLSALQTADAIIYNGWHLEGKLTDVLQRMARQGRAVHALTDALTAADQRADPDQPDAADPHIWFDPGLWSKAAGGVAAFMARVNPAAADHYAARLAILQAELAALHTWAGQQLAVVPEPHRILVTSHDAFGYFGRAFGWEVHGIQGISTATEAALGDMGRLIGRVRDAALPAIFIESSVSPRTIRRLSETSGARIGGDLFSDALGALGELRTVGDTQYAVGTYDGMFRYNVATIAAALAPAID